MTLRYTRHGLTLIALSLATFGFATPVAADPARPATAEPEATDSVTVVLTNQRSASVYVAFTQSNHAPGPITWGSGCEESGAGAQIASGATCNATVDAAAGSSRFCATESQVPADCYDAQTNHQTMIETTFEASTNPGCFEKGACVWYDISVIPSNCTNDTWKQDQCANTGGAAYNLPVELWCTGQATFTCQGPANGNYGNANYPSNCGDPNGTCVGNTQQCVNAFFYPMFGMPNEPNVACLGAPLNVTFLAGS